MGYRDIRDIFSFLVSASPRFSLRKIQLPSKSLCRYFLKVLSNNFHLPSIFSEKNSHPLYILGKKFTSPENFRKKFPLSSNFTPSPGFPLRKLAP